jgi:hypothetical protein
MTAIGIDLDIGDTVRAIDEILARRASAETTVWDSLRDELEAIAHTTMALDEMYLSLLTEIEDIAAQADPSAERIAAVLRQGHLYCSSRDLVGRLVELQAAVQVAAFHDDLKRRRYREISSTLHSIDSRLGTYIARLRRFQNGEDPEAQGKGKHCDLRMLLDLLARQAPFGLRTDDEISVIDACEEAIRNFDGALSEDLWSLIGRARQQLAMARLP